MAARQGFVLSLLDALERPLRQTTWFLTLLSRMNAARNDWFG